MMLARRKRKMLEKQREAWNKYKYNIGSIQGYASKISTIIFNQSDKHSKFSNMFRADFL